MKELVLLGSNSIQLGAVFFIGQKWSELFVVRDQFVQQDFLSIAIKMTSPHSMAAVPCNGVEPGGQSIGAFNLAEIFERSKEDFLHRVLCILTMPTHLHTERKNGILQQPDTLFNRFRRVFCKG